VHEHHTARNSHSTSWIYPFLNSKLPSLSAHLFHLLSLMTSTFLLLQPFICAFQFNVLPFAWVPCLQSNLHGLCRPADRLKLYHTILSWLTFYFPYHCVAFRPGRGPHRLSEVLLHRYFMLAFIMCYHLLCVRGCSRTWTWPAQAFWGFITSPFYAGIYYVLPYFLSVVTVGPGRGPHRLSEALLHRRCRCAFWPTKNVAHKRVPNGERPHKLFVLQF